MQVCLHTQVLDVHSINHYHPFWYGGWRPLPSTEANASKGRVKPNIVPICESTCTKAQQFVSRASPAKPVPGIKVNERCKEPVRDVVLQTRRQSQQSALSDQHKVEMLTVLIVHAETHLLLCNLYLLRRCDRACPE